jgi:uncharacterized protein (TIGR00645 family)
MFRTQKDVEHVIYRSKYLLLLGYLAMAIVLASFLLNMTWDALQLAWNMHGTEVSARTIGILEVLDNIMIANVVYLIIRGSYMVYVRDSDQPHSSRPQAFNHLTPGGLKERMAASLVGVSSVHLLQVLINVGNEASGYVSWHDIGIKVGIHMMLIIGLVVFYVINRGEEAEELEADA